MLTRKFSKLLWWQIGLLSLAASAIGSLASLQSSKKDKTLYNKKLKQAPWAPPSWLFGPAWSVNNFFLLLALQRILESHIQDKKALLALQGSIWIIYFSFSYIYFKKKSPIMAGVWTKGDIISALSSFIITYKRDKKAAYYYLPLILWTLFAGSLADYQALKNPDPLFHTKALAD